MVIQATCNTKIKLDGQLAGQSAGALLFLVLEEKEPKQKTIPFNESNVMGVWTDKLTSMKG